MKKFVLYIIGAVFMIAACTPFVHEKSDAVVPAGDPTIAVSAGAVKDSTLTAVITAPEGTTFYSYAVMPGPKQALNPETLLKVGYKDALAAATVDARTEGGASTTVELDELNPNTWYFVYAIAANKQGTFGNIAIDSLMTSDKGIPGIAKNPSFDGARKMTVTFTEPVKKGDGKVTAHIMKVFPASGTEGSYSEVIPADSIAVKGSDVIFSLKDTIPGAYVFFTWDDKAFTDMAGNAVPAYNRVDFEPSDIFNDEPESRGVFGRVEPKAWDLAWSVNYEKGNDTTVLFFEYNTLAINLYTPEINGGYGDEASVKVRYKLWGRETLIPLDYTRFEFPVEVDGKTALSISLPEDMEPLTEVDVIVEKDSFYDEYGNPNNEYVIESGYRKLLRSTGVTGVYTCRTTDYFGNIANLEIVVKNVSGSNYSIEGLFPLLSAIGVEEPMTAVYDSNENALKIAAGQTACDLFTIEPNKFPSSKLYVFNGPTGDEKDLAEALTLSIDENGSIVSDNAYGAYIEVENNFYERFLGNMQFVKTSNDLPAAPSPGPSSVSFPSGVMLKTRSR